MKCCRTFYASADRRANTIPQTINDHPYSRPNVSKNNTSTNNGTRTNKPRCGKCKNHGIIVNLRGHSSQCPKKDCICSLCILQEQRRDLAKLSKEFERREPSDPYRTLQALASYNIPDKNLFFGPMRSPVQLMMPSPPIPGPRITPDATPHLGYNNPGRPTKVAYPGSPRTISVHSTSTVDEFMSSSSDGSSPPHRPSAFREVSGGLDPNQKYKAMERLKILLLRKLGDSYDHLPSLSLALLAECDYDPEEAKRKIQSGAQELLDEMNMVLRMDPADDYVDVNFYTDDDEDDTEDGEGDEIPDEVEPCSRSLE